MSESDLITRQYLEWELGLKKEETENGVVFYEFEQGKHFFVSLFTDNSMYFVDEDLQAGGEGIYTNGIISSLSTFKKLYL